MLACWLGENNAAVCFFCTRVGGFVEGEANRVVSLMLLRCVDADGVFLTKS
jgi:hypothetical protein